MAKQKTTQKLGHCRNTRDADEKRLGEIGRRISVLEGEIGARQEELSGLRKEARRIKARIQYADEKKARASIEVENAKLKAEILRLQELVGRAGSDAAAADDGSGMDVPAVAGQTSFSYDDDADGSQDDMTDAQRLVP